MNYELYIDGDGLEEPIEFKFIDEAITAGQRLGGGKFLIWYGDLFCCIGHPDLGVIYSEEYKEWYQNYQRAYDQVS